MFNTTDGGYFPWFENFTPMDTLKDGRHVGFDIELAFEQTNPHTNPYKSKHILTALQCDRN